MMLSVVWCRDSLKAWWSKAPSVLRWRNNNGALAYSNVTPHVDIMDPDSEAVRVLNYTCWRLSKIVAAVAAEVAAGSMRLVGGSKVDCRRTLCRSRRIPAQRKGAGQAVRLCWHTFLTAQLSPAGPQAAEKLRASSPVIRRRTNSWTGCGVMCMGAVAASIALRHLVTSAQAPTKDPVPSTDVLPGLAVRESILTTLPCRLRALFRPRAVQTTT